MSGVFVQALRGETVAAPPIWMMRQAGRYQRSYRERRIKHSFDTLCRTPEIAADVALAAVEEFDFDAGILFSDLLFPLEALGFGLTYEEGPPKLSRRLTPDFCDQLRPLSEALPALAFQAEAVRATRARLPQSKGLIGFVGGPWTLFVYAMEGSHTGPLTAAKSSPDLYRQFADRLTPLLIGMAREQLEAGADLVMVFDTAAGELSPATFRELTAPDLCAIGAALPGRVGYYAKGLHPAHLADATWLDDWAVLGVDARWDMSAVLADPKRRTSVQGNFDPALLHMQGPALERAIDQFIGPVARLTPEARRGWICGLGHGVLPATPEDHVRLFVDRVREECA